ncbi:MAG: glutamate synthase subunit beta [Anaeroplasma sp.]
MGKPTGFMEYERVNKGELPIGERIKGYNDFHLSLDLITQQHQAARCMNCGIPFCQSAMKIEGKNVGCPLSNLIPEWNHLIYLGLYEEAYKRLEATALFPEFTGSVCPALCEAACSCSINGESVGIKCNELFLIEEAFKNGWIKPKKSIDRNGLKAAIIGSGPAGLSCAKTLNYAGFDVTVYEKNDRFGGLLMYGIPNMKIDKSIIERRIDLLKEEGIKFINNTKVGVDIKIQALNNEFDEIIYACGTSLARPLQCKNSNLNGIVYAVDFLTETTKAVLNKTSFKYDLRNKNVVIVGGGDTANDCCATAARMNAKSIIELEITKEPPLENTKPWPYYPNKKKTDYGVAEANYLMGKDIRRYETTIDEVVGKESIEGIYIKKVEQSLENGRLVFKDSDSTREYLPCDILIIAMGFLGTSEDDLNSYELKHDRFKVNLDDFFYNDKISVCGDMKNGQSLVVVAIKDGLDCANRIINKYQK